MNLLNKITAAKGFYLVANEVKINRNPYKGYKFRAS